MLREGHSVTVEAHAVMVEVRVVKTVEVVSGGPVGDAVVPPAEGEPPLPEPSFPEPPLPEPLPEPLLGAGVGSAEGPVAGPVPEGSVDVTECDPSVEAGTEETTGAELDSMGRTVGRDEGCGWEVKVTRVREDEEAIPEGELVEEVVTWLDETGGMTEPGMDELDGRDEMTDEGTEIEAAGVAVDEVLELIQEVVVSPLRILISSRATLAW